MISDQMAARLLEQAKREWESAYIYLGMMAWCTNNQYNGFAKWFRLQADEELTHGWKILDYLSEVDRNIEIPGIEKPPANYKGVDHAFETALNHECKVTKWIGELVDLATAEKDHATFNFLQWYVSEQVEEEATARDIVNTLKRLGTSAGSLYHYELHVLKQRIREKD